MKKIKTFFQRPLVLLFLSALLSALPFTFPSLFLLSWVGFVPFFGVILSRSGEGRWLSALGRGAFFGFFYHLFIYYWFLWLYPMDFAGLDRAASLCVVLLAWIGISFFHGLIYAIPTLLCHFVGKVTKNCPFLLFCGVVGVLFGEKLTELSQLAFPWSRISLGQYRAPALIQSASLFGIEGVDFLILAVGAAIALAFFIRGKKCILSLALAFLIFLSNLTFGALALFTHREEGESVLIASVQGCILSGEKWTDSSHSLERYLSLTQEVSSKTEIVVWPESAVAVNLYFYPDLVERYRSLAEEKDISLLMGCFWKKDGATTNSAILIDKNGQSAPYSKQHLVPFGEKVPYRQVLSKIVPFLTQINMLSSDLAAGTSSALMDWEEGKLGTVICFESMFPELARKSTNDGAQMLFVITNDSWYEDSPAVYQHLAHSVFRSVENHRSLVRCANSGVSAFIDENGRILTELGPLEMGVLEEEVSFSQKTTLYSRLGSWVLPVLVFFLALWGAILLLQQQKRKQNV